MDKDIVSSNPPYPQYPQFLILPRRKPDCGLDKSSPYMNQPLASLFSLFYSLCKIITPR
jgi:hypothetical protein